MLKHQHILLLRNIVKSHFQFIFKFEEQKTKHIFKLLLQVCQLSIKHLKFTFFYKTAVTSYCCSLADKYNSRLYLNLDAVETQSNGKADM